MPYNSPDVEEYLRATDPYYYRKLPWKKNPWEDLFGYGQGGSFPGIGMDFYGNVPFGGALGGGQSMFFPQEQIRGQLVGDSEFNPLSLVSPALKLGQTLMKPSPTSPAGTGGFQLPVGQTMFDLPPDIMNFMGLTPYEAPYGPYPGAGSLDIMGDVGTSPYEAPYGPYPGAGSLDIMGDVGGGGLNLGGLATGAIPSLTGLAGSMVGGKYGGVAGGLAGTAGMNAILGKPLFSLASLASSLPSMGLSFIPMSPESRLGSSIGSSAGTIAGLAGLGPTAFLGPAGLIAGAILGEVFDRSPAWGSKSTLDWRGIEGARLQEKQAENVLQDLRAQGYNFDPMAGVPTETDPNRYFPQQVMDIVLSGQLPFDYGGLTPQEMQDLANYGQFSYFGGKPSFESSPGQQLSGDLADWEIASRGGPSGW